MASAFQPCLRRARCSQLRPAMRREPWLAVTVLVALAIFGLCLANALAWINRPFPGFLVLENGIVVSIGRSDWIPPERRRAQWTRVIAVDGHPVSGGREINAYVSAADVGRPITYTFRGGSDIFRLALEVRAFRMADFLDLFAPLLGVGLVMVCGGAVTLVRRPGAPEARALFAMCLSLGLALITGPDQYSPYTFSPLFFLSLSALPPSITLFALTYPSSSGLLRHGALPYAALYLPCAGLGTALSSLSSQTSLFLPLLYTVYFFTANAVLLGVGSVVLALINGVRPAAPLLLVLGAALGSCLPIAILVTYPLLQRPISPVMLVCPLLFIPALIGTALVRFPAFDHASGA